MQMRRLLISALCGLMAMPAVSSADDHGRPPPPSAYRNDGRHAPPPPHYRAPPVRYAGYRYYPYRAPHVYYGYPYYGKKQHSDNDDALWAIGGLVVGALLVNAAQNASAPPPATASAPAPAAVAESCYDDIIHDSAGNPHVERHCYPATTP
jgi:hypothetical protein